MAIIRVQQHLVLFRDSVNKVGDVGIVTRFTRVIDNVEGKDMHLIGPDKDVDMDVVGAQECCKLCVSEAEHLCIAVCEECLWKACECVPAVLPVPIFVC